MTNNQPKYIPNLDKISDFWKKPTVVDSGTSTSTAYSRLAHRLERELAQEGRGSTLLMMAAEYDRIAVESIAELGWHLADDLGYKVLLVDGGFNAMGLTRDLGGKDCIGLTDLLASDDLSEDLVQSTIRTTPHSRVFHIPVGQDQSNRLTPVGGGKSMSHFLSIASGIADFVLIQGPAVAKASRTLAFASLVDAVLLVTLEGESSFSKLNESQKILTESGAERIGLVVGVSRSHSA